MATKPIQPTLPFNPEEIKPSTVKPKAVDGLGLSMKDYYWDVSTQQFERRDNPPEHISSSVKVGSPAHKQKFPDRYKSGYVDWWNRDKKEKINNDVLKEIISKLSPEVIIETLDTFLSKDIFLYEILLFSFTLIKFSSSITKLFLTSLISSI